MVLAILDTDAAFLVGECIDAIHRLVVAEHLEGQLEQCCRVLLLTEIHPLVALQVLRPHGSGHGVPNLQVSTVHTIREQRSHLLLSLLKILAALDNRLCLLNLFLLGFQTRD